MKEHWAPILYICDNLDKKEHYRSRLIKRWFEEFGSEDLRHDYRIIEFDDYTIILEIITFHRDVSTSAYFNRLEDFRLVKTSHTRYFYPFI